MVIPLVMTALKWPALPTSEFFSRLLTLADLPAPMHRRLYYILFIPVGAILVVLCRLTFGIRLLGPFRSILLGVAFQITGILAGILFLVPVIAAIVVIRPTLKAMRLPYFSRVSVILSLVSAIMIGVILLGNWLDADALRRVAYFPIVVLCLVGEGFARTLNKESMQSALWRGSMTVLIAILLAWLSQMPWLRHLLLNYPELLLVQMGGIIAISEFFDLRLFQWLNPSYDDEDIFDGKQADPCSPEGLAV
ncbi:MAG: hypothetical protein JW829_05065 [Pirellulales bacterium]|nr:hypothetical protein [Pirellulales bacterium]